MNFGVSSSVKTDPETDEPITSPDGINLTAAAAVTGFYEGKHTLGDVATAFISEMPIIPICYRSGVIMFTHKLSCEPICSASDIFSNINSYSFNN
jgi:hypothetical protein